MSLVDALETLLTTDATFVAGIRALNLGSKGDPATPKVIKSFRTLRSIGQEHFPCWAMEVGDANTTDRAVGSCHQGAQREILLGLLWHQQTPETAFDQREALWDLLVALFLRNPMPDAEATVHVDAMATDRNANPPSHITTFRLLADVETRQ